jgi:UDP-glucose 4-epimerase
LEPVFSTELFESRTNMAVALVTGGAGFIGSHLVEALVAHGHAVRVLDDFSTGRLGNLDQVKDRIELVTGSVTDAPTVQAATRGVQLLFHLAGPSPADADGLDPLALHHACTTGTLQVLLAAREAGVKRVVYASSSEVYGLSPPQAHRESDPPRPHSLYAVNKVIGEQYCEAFTWVFQLETVRLRFFNVYGPRQRSDGPSAPLIPFFLQALLKGRSPLIYGDGLQSGDFTFVGDVVQGNLLAAEAWRASGKVYNVAFGRQTTLQALVDLMNDLLGTRIKPVHKKPRFADIRSNPADTSLAQAELGFCPVTGLEEGLRRCIAYYTARPEGADPGPAPAPAGLGKPHLKLLGTKDPTPQGD